MLVGRVADSRVERITGDQALGDRRRRARAALPQHGDAVGTAGMTAAVSLLI